MRSPAEIQAERERLEAVRQRINAAIKSQDNALIGKWDFSLDPFITQLVVDASGWLEGKTECSPSKSWEGAVE